MGIASIATIVHEKKGDPEVMLKTLEEMKNIGIPAHVSVGQGSSDEFIKQIQGMGHHTKIVNGSVSVQIANALKMAADNSDIIIYTEGDKQKWVKERLIISVLEFLENGFDLAAISRTHEQMQTYPDNQIFRETQFRNFFKRKTGIDTDLVFGPKIFRSFIIKDTLRDLNPKEIEALGWGILVYPFSKSYNYGYRTGSIFQALAANPSQVKAEQGIKKFFDYRKLQTGQNITGTRLGLAG